MFKDLGIKGRILLLTLLPSSLLALVLGMYFITAQLRDVQSQLQQRGELIIKPLAPLAANALQDEALLTRIAQAALEQTDVRSVSFLTASGNLLTSAGPQMLNPPPSADPQRLTHTSAFDATRFLFPILGRHRDFNQIDKPGSGKLLGWVELELSHQGSLLQAYRSLFTSLALIILGLVVTALLALRMGRAIHSPLQLIQQGVAQIKDGRLETRLAPPGSRELDELADGINRMTEALQLAQDEMQLNIEQATEDVRQNLETIEIQNIELDLARKEALEGSRIKSEFLANMSHEIRTPLNGIIGFTNLLNKTKLAPRQRDYLQTIHQSSNNLLDIINEVLDFSKIEAGKLTLDNIPFNLRDLIQDCLTILAPSAHSKQLELVSLIYRDTPRALLGDPLRMRQILTNLISNAIKFTHKGSIIVRAMLEDEDDERALLRISVQDSGVGLTETELHSLFNAFSQADNSLTRQTGGTGLGLVISKRLIEQMGGSIGVKSVPEEGSEFWISLSLAKTHEDEESPPAVLKGRKVAVFEPHALACQSLQHQLEDCGLEVHVFDDLNAMQEALARNQHSRNAISLAVLGIDPANQAPELLQQVLKRLEQLDCKTLLLCPTTEQGLLTEAVPEIQHHVQAKPACTRKLKRGLCELVNPRLASLDARDNAEFVLPTHPSGRPPRLLCVDDNPANLLLVRTLLEDMGADVVAVNSGYAALEATAQERFDLIFMDIQMPGMDGRQATLGIRQQELEQQCQSTPILALTAHALASEKRALLQDGMDDYLTKPINERQLAQLVLKWTGHNLRQTLNYDEPAVTPQSGDLAVLDKDEGLKLAAGKADLAADMLSMLLASLPADQSNLRRLRSAGEHLELIEQVHRLHGATRYCGVPQLRGICQHCESLLKTADPRAPHALDELDAAITRLLNETSQTVAS